MKTIRSFFLIGSVLASMIHSASGAITLETLYSFGHNTNANGAAPFEIMRGLDGNFYGSTLYGGPGGYGTIFKLTTNGTLTTLFGFNQANGELPQGRLVQGPNGVLYGTTPFGGTNGPWGTVFKLTTNGVFTSLISFTNNEQQPVYPYAGLVLATNGLLYGVGAYGGSNAYGAMFVINTNGVMTTLAAFDYLNGDFPVAALLQASDGNFYGTASQGGSNSLGTIFRATASGELTLLVEMRGTNGAYPQMPLVQGPDGLLYGATYQGGQSGNGLIFKMTLAGALTPLYSFANSANGANPEVLLQAPDSMLYGTTLNGGTNNGPGTIFQITTNGAFTSLHSMTYDEGYYPHGLALGNNGVLYGATQAGGTNGNGTIYKLTTNGTFTSLFAFQNPFATDGANPNKLVQGPGGLLYGTSGGGGAYGNGTVFAMTTNGLLTGHYSFTGGNDGDSPSCILAARDGQLYGATSYGGSNGSGTIFKMTTNGTLTTLFVFNGDDGYQPRSLVQGIDDNFYGVTVSGGIDNYGIVFRVTPAGAFTTLASFLTGGGRRPNTLLQRNDGTFYGTTLEGGANGFGTIFKMTSAGVLTTIYDFSVSSGNDASDLIAGPDGNLYGTAEADGSVGGSGNGVVFRVTTNGSYTILHLFANSNEGVGPESLTPGSDGNFYGTTLNGGTTGNGVLFRVKTNGTFTLLYSFDGTGDGGGSSGLVQGKDLKFYGTTQNSGTNNGGTFFRFSVPTGPSIAVQPASLTNHAGTIATFTVDADGILPLKYQWRKNLTNLTNGGRISGVTSTTLSLSNVTSADNGSYSVVITNNFGSATSSNATLTVLPTLAEALDTTNLVWLTGGDADWFGQPWITHDGADAAQSGIILDSEESWLQTTVNGPGVITFWWNVSSESSYDFLNFFVNAELKASISGETGWQQQSVNVPSGSQPLLWVYEKDFSLSLGADRAWVDQVSFAPAVSFVPPVFQPVTRSNTTLILGWSTVPGFQYQLQYTTNLTQTNWINLGSPTTNGSASTPIGPDRQRFYRVLLLP